MATGYHRNVLTGWLADVIPQIAGSGVMGLRTLRWNYFTNVQIVVRSGAKNGGHCRCGGGGAVGGGH